MREPTKNWQFSSENNGCAFGPCHTQKNLDSKDNNWSQISCKGDKVTRVVRCSMNPTQEVQRKLVLVCLWSKIIY
jgi:hypothetical protein